MKKRFIPVLLTAAIITGCGGGGGQDATKTARQAKGDVVYGGVFKCNEVENFRNLYPLSVTDATSHRIANQIYEGLVTFNQKDLSIVPRLAEKWEVNDDATSFTFHIRKGVKFHDNPCFPEGKAREVTAHDVHYSLTRLHETSPDNHLYWLMQGKIKGGEEYYQSTIDGKPLKEGVTGIKVLDDYTIQLDLNYSFSGLLNLLGHPACWVYPKEAFDKYGVDMRVNPVGTGPFRLKTIKEGDAIVLERNPDYWRSDQHGNVLPYLDAVKINFMREKKSELLEFKKGNLDMIHQLPLEMINDVIGEYQSAGEDNVSFDMQVSTAFSIQYYGFQHKSEIFSDKRVRLAFNYAIDRERIVTYTLQGDGKAATSGIVPEGFVKYAYDSLQGYSFDPKKARQLLAEAGYANGKGFPKLTLQLNSGGGTNEHVSEVIQKMLKENLNIDVQMNIMPFPQHLENLETGKALFWRIAWITDYPDPESFLQILYGKPVPEDINERASPNSVRYQNAVYDSLFELALRETDEDERYRLYRLADQQQLNDGAILPIYYEEYTRLLQKNVRNFPQNPMEFRDFSEVFFKEPEPKQEIPHKGI